MRKILAQWLYPISSAPIENGLLVMENDTVLEVLAPDHIQYSIDDNTQHHEGILCPGFINAHCHLELSYLKRKIPIHTGLHDFIKQVEQQKPVAPEEIQAAITLAAQEMAANGIVAVGDICNTNR